MLHLLLSLTKLSVIFSFILYLQTKSEGKVFKFFTITGKFWKLISTIIEKSWPRDSQGHYQDDEEVVLRHLLSWTAAKDILHLHGNIVHLITTSACLLVLKL